MRRVGLISLVLLFLSSHSLSATSLRILAYFRGENYGDKLAYKVAPAGDVNLDGYADVFVGASGADKVYLYYGGSPMDTTADLVFNRIISGLWDVGDVNEDGYGDFVMGDSVDERVQLFYGGAVLDTIAEFVFMGEDVGKYGDNFGSWVSGGEDVNGDDQNDLLIAANDYGVPGTYDGRVYLYHGGSLLDTTADWTVTYVRILGHQDAWSAAIIGDVNSDGYADIGVGSIGSGTDVPGKIYVYFGGSSVDTLPDLILNSPQVWSHFGAHIAPLGDINQDGYDDFVTAGMAAYPCVYFGAKVLDTVPGIICQYPGYVACNAGDINHDGYDDLLVGHEAYGYGKGAIYLYFGSADMDSICDFTITGYDLPLWVREFGKSVAGLGDVDGDGVDDFIVGGREGYDPWDKGEAWIFAGDSTLSTDVQEEEEYLVEFNMLEQNYPNPFNSSTIIRFTVHCKQRTENGPVRTTLKIYNIRGQLVRTLVNEELNHGEYRVSWDGKNNQGKEVSSGVYFYRLKTGEFVQTKKMVLIH